MQQPCALLTWPLAAGSLAAGSGLADRGPLLPIPFHLKCSRRAAPAVGSMDGWLLATLQWCTLAAGAGNKQLQVLPALQWLTQLVQVRAMRDWGAGCRLLTDMDARVRRQGLPLVISAACVPAAEGSCLHVCHVFLPMTSSAGHAVPYSACSWRLGCLDALSRSHAPPDQPA